MTKNWSKYQKNIFREYDSTNNNICIIAAAGSGKSTTIVELLNRTPLNKKGIFLAFNKSIAEELSKKIPQQTKASTIHSMGVGLLYKYLNRNIKISEYKNFIIAKNNLKINHLKPDKISAFLFLLSKMVDMFRINLGRTYEDLLEINNKYDILSDNLDLELAWKLIEFIDEYNIREDHKEYLINFTDMIFLPIFFEDKITFPQYDVVLLDETQDISLLQKRLIDKIIKKRTGRIVCVGDPKQTIYNFIGANKQSFKEFLDAPRTTTLPLSVSYRCPKKIVEEANKVFEGMEAFDGNIDGEVIYDGTLEHVKDGDLILCRNNLPLVEVFLELLFKQKRAIIYGKDYEKGLLLLLSKLNLNKDKESVLREMDIMLNNLRKELNSKGVFNIDKHPKYQALLERIMILTIISSKYDSFVEMESILDKMFSDDISKGIILSTIHKFKGRESDNVFFYMPSLIPSKYAESQDELFAEKALYYVAITRAKKKLTYVN